MIVEKIALTNFRNYSKLALTFDKGLNVFVGKNGVGKTNLMEAINYLSLARSFRTAEDPLLIQKGKPFASIQAVISEEQQKRSVEIVITEEGKRVTLNQKPISKLSELTSWLNVLLFEPRDVLMFDDVPKVRRKFLDVSLSKQSKSYLELMTVYERLLKQRNDLLKTARVNLDHLAVLTEQMVDVSIPLMKARFQYLKDIDGIIGKVVQQIKGTPMEVGIEYLAYVPLQGDIKQQALEEFKAHQEIDIKRKVTNAGLHREDFVVKYQSHDVAGYGSQGENRLISLALKLSPYFLVKEQEKRPIIILDDVLSELDEPTQIKLIRFVQKLGQVFITATEFPVKGVAISEIKNQQILRRNA